VLRAVTDHPAAASYHRVYAAESRSWQQCRQEAIL